MSSNCLKTRFVGFVRSQIRVWDIVIRIQTDSWIGLDPQEAGYQRLQAAGDQGGAANHKTNARSIIECLYQIETSKYEQKS